MYKRIVIIVIMAILYACVIDIRTKSIVFSQTSNDSSLSFQPVQTEMSNFPTFDASDEMLDTAIQNAKTALKHEQFKKALEFANQALDHVKSYYHMMSEERLETHHLFIDIYEKQKEYAAAEKHFQQAYTIQKKLYGERHEHTLRMLENLSVFYIKWGKRDKAEETLQLINILYQDIFGTNHKKTMASINQLAAFYINNQEYEKARPYVTQAVKINANLFGNDAMSNMAPLMQAGKTYYHCESYDRALKTFERALNLIQKHGGKPFHIRLEILQNLARLNVMNKKFKKAESLYQKAIVLSRKVHGSKNRLQLTYNKKLIELYQLQGQNDKIKQQLQNNIELTKTISGQNNPEIIASQKALADFLFDQKDYTHAATVYEQALQNCKKQYGIHEKTLRLSKRLAETYIAQSQFQAAVTLLKSNINTYSGLLGSTRDSLQFLAQIYKQQGNCHEAIPLMDQVFRLNESTLGPSHPKTLYALTNLIGCMIEEKRNIDALNLLKRIEPALYKTQWEKNRNQDMSVSDQTEFMLNAQTFCHAVFTLARGMTDS